MSTAARRLIHLVLGLALAGLPVAGTAAQAAPSSQPFPANGGFVVLGFSGAAEDFVIPTTDPPAQISLSVKGGSGGDAKANEAGCISYGGSGAKLLASFEVGAGSLLAPGGTLRFIIGQRGADDDPGAWLAAGHGGGGSGVLYRAPGGSEWIPLLVAGGGGGAFQARNYGCDAAAPGEDASLTGCGTAGDGYSSQNPGPGGCDGLAGTPGGVGVGSDLVGGAGGGLYSAYPDGHSGAMGLPAGGANAYASTLGWGCGGGGAGQNANSGPPHGAGGGGGYSGGGGGAGNKGANGGGGGSYVHPAALLVTKFVASSPEDGTGFLAALAAQTGEDCVTAEIIPSLGDGGVWNGSGATVGKLPTALAGCSLGTTGDTWFRYTNTSACAQVLSVGATQQLPPHLIEAWSQCSGGTLLGCAGFDLFAPPLSVSVPAGGDVWLRILPATEGPTGTVFTLQAAATSQSPDSDGDGIPDCEDNCPSTANPLQEDADFDGVGDACDACPGFDDGLDDDADGVPDNCDACPGSDDGLDGDLDGVPDGCDTCMGDDTVDSDQDGLPDDCDPDPFSDSTLDCDANQRADATTAFESRYESFQGVLIGGTPAPAFYTLNFAAAAQPLVADGVLRLTEAGVPGQIASAVFEPVTAAPTDHVRVQFDFRMGPGTGGGADGLSLSLLDPAVHGPTTLFGENGATFASLDVSFDVFQNAGEPSDNFIGVRYDGALLAQVPIGVPLEAATWLRAEVIVTDAGLLSVRLSQLLPSPFSEVHVEDLVVPGWQAKAWRYGFGARCGGSTNQVLLDNVLFEALDDAGDCNGDGVVDACEETWVDLGPGTALAGTGGDVPTLDGDGDLCSGDWTRVSLGEALPSSTAYLILGFTEASVPFRGGVLVPSPDVIQPIPTGPSGSVDLVFTWFDGLPVDFELWLQAWVVDPGAVSGASASNALKLTTP